MIGTIRKRRSSYYKPIWHYILLLFTVACFSNHGQQNISDITQKEDELSKAFSLKVPEIPPSESVTIKLVIKQNVLREKLILFKENISKEYSKDFFQNFIKDYNEVTYQQKIEITKKIAEYTLEAIGKSKGDPNTLINITRFISENKDIGKNILKTEIEIDSKKQSVGSALSTCYYDNIKDIIKEVGLSKIQLNKIQNMYGAIKKMGSKTYNMLVSTIERIIPFRKEGGSPMVQEVIQKIFTLISLLVSYYAFSKGFSLYTTVFVGVTYVINSIWLIINWHC